MFSRLKNRSFVHRLGVASIGAVLLVPGVTTLMDAAPAGADITVGTNPIDITIDTATNIAYVANEGNV